MFISAQYISKFEDEAQDVCEYDFLQTLKDDGKFADITITSSFNHDMVYITNSGSSGPCPKYILPS